jgi:hypothetical protein
MKKQVKLSILLITFLMFLGVCVNSAGAVELVTLPLTDNDVNDIFPQVSGMYAVWEQEDPNEGDLEIMFFDSEYIIQLTDNSTDDTNPQIFGKNVVWQGLDPNEGDWEIFFFDGHTVEQLTQNAYDDIEPKISDSMIIWESWDGNDWEIHTAVLPATGGMKVTPQALNLKSKGKWIQVNLKLPAGMTASQVDKTSLLLMGQVPVGKVLNDEKPNKLKLKFNRADVQALLAPGPEVDIFLTGQLKNGTVFEASDTIKVIQPGN